MAKNLTYDGVGFNAGWVAGFKTEKTFLSRQENNHLFPEKDPLAKVQALKEVYALCRQEINPELPAASTEKMPSSEEPKDGD